MSKAPEATADLTISLLGPATAAVNTTFVETLKVTNKGPSTAAPATASLEIPSGVTVKSAPGSRVVKGGSRYYLVWTTKALPNGGSATYTPQFLVSPGTGRYAVIHAGTSSLTKDPVTANNQTTITVKLGKVPANSPT